MLYNVKPCKIVLLYGMGVVQNDITHLIVRGK